jgi:signal transduction histidine kinase
LRIQTKHTLGLIAFSLVPLAIAMGGGYTWSRRALLVTERDRLEMLGTLKVAQLRSDIEAHAQVSHRLRREFGERGLGDLPPLRRASAWSDWLLGAAASVGPNTELAILDLNGTVRAATRTGMEGRTWAGAPRIEAGRVQPKTVGPHLRPDDPEAIEDAVYEPLTTTSGTTVAELAIMGNTAALRNWLFDDLSPGMRATLATLSGQRLADWPPTPADPDEQGASRVEARFRLDDGGALLTLSTREARALGPLVLLRQLGLAALVLVALAAVALAVVLGRALASPVHALANEAGRIGAGDLGPMAPYPRDDEFAFLWRAMDGMRAELVENRDRVQQFLEERTTALVGQQQLVGSLFEALPDVVFVVTPDHRIAAANRTARRVYGDDVERQPCHQVLHGHSAPCPECPLERVLAGESSAQASISIAAATREAVAVALSPVGPAGSSSATALYTGRIVTRERTLQTRLAHQEKMAALGALAAGVAHEVRNPLASLSSLVQVRLRDPGLDARTRGELSVVLDHVQRIDRTVKNLTAAAREPSSGRRPALLQELVERVVQLARYDPRARGVTLTVRSDRDAPPLQLDEDAWLQVLLNLVVNALDAVETSAHREVVVEVARSEQGVELLVWDTGCGMSETVLQNATAPLFTTKPPGRGTGLGLHLVREVVEQHGGCLRITSAEGEGTAVRISLSAPPSSVTFLATQVDVPRS